MLEGIREEETPELFLQEGIEADKFILVEPEIDKQYNKNLEKIFMGRK